MNSLSLTGSAMTAATSRVNARAGNVLKAGSPGYRRFAGPADAISEISYRSGVQRLPEQGASVEQEMLAQPAANAAIALYARIANTTGSMMGRLLDVMV